MRKKQAHPITGEARKRRRSILYSRGETKLDPGLFSLLGESEDNFMTNCFNMRGMNGWEDSLRQKPKKVVQFASPVVSEEFKLQEPIESPLGQDNPQESIPQQSQPYISSKRKLDIADEISSQTESEKELWNGRLRKHAEQKRPTTPTVPKPKKLRLTDKEQENCVQETTSIENGQKSRLNQQKPLDNVAKSIVLKRKPIENVTKAVAQKSKNLVCRQETGMQKLKSLNNVHEPKSPQMFVANLQRSGNQKQKCHYGVQKTVGRRIVQKHVSASSKLKVQKPSSQKRRNVNTVRETPSKIAKSANNVQRCNSQKSKSSNNVESIRKSQNVGNARQMFGQAEKPQNSESMINSMKSSAMNVGRSSLRKQQHINNSIEQKGQEKTSGKNLPNPKQRLKSAPNVRRLRNTGVNAEQKVLSANSVQEAKLEEQCVVGAKEPHKQLKILVNKVQNSQVKSLPKPIHHTRKQKNNLPNVQPQKPHKSRDDAQRSNLQKRQSCRHLAKTGNTCSCLEKPMTNKEQDKANPLENIRMRLRNTRFKETVQMQPTVEAVGDGDSPQQETSMQNSESGVTRVSVSKTSNSNSTFIAVRTTRQRKAKSVNREKTAMSKIGQQETLMPIFLHEENSESMDVVQETSSQKPQSMDIVQETSFQKPQDIKVQESNSQKPQSMDVVQEVSSQKPQSMVDVQQTSSQKPQPMDDVQEVSCQKPQSMIDVQQTSSQKPQSMDVVQEVSSQKPQSMVDVQQTSSQKPQPMDAVQEVSCQKPQSMIDVQQTSSQKPQSMDVVQEVSSQKPQSMVDVQQTSSQKPQAVNDIQESSFHKPQSQDDVQETSFPKPQSMDDNREACSTKPQSMGDVQELSSRKAQITNVAKESSSQMTQSMDDVQETRSQKPQFKDVAQESSSQKPQSMGDIREACSQKPQSMNDFQETSSQKSQFMDDVQETSSQKPQSMDDVQESSSRKPQSMADVQASSSQKPQSMADVQEASSQKPQSMNDFQETSSQKPQSMDGVQEASSQKSESSSVDVTQKTSPVERNRIDGIQQTTSQKPKPMEGVWRTVQQDINSMYDVQVNKFQAPNCMNPLQETAPQTRTCMDDVREIGPLNPKRFEVQESSVLEIGVFEVTSINDLRRSCPQNSKPMDGVEETTCQEPKPMDDVQEPSSQTPTPMDDVQEPSSREPKPMDDVQEPSSPEPKPMDDIQETSSRTPKPMDDVQETSSQTPKPGDIQEPSSREPNRMDVQETSSQEPKPMDDVQEISSQTPKPGDIQEPSSREPNHMDVQETSSQEPKLMDNVQETSSPTLKPGDIQEPSSREPNRMDVQETSSPEPKPMDDVQETSSRKSKPKDDVLETSSRDLKPMDDVQEKSMDVVEIISQTPEAMDAIQEINLAEPDSVDAFQEISSEEAESLDMDLLEISTVELDTVEETDCIENAPSTTVNSDHLGTTNHQKSTEDVDKAKEKHSEETECCVLLQKLANNTSEQQNEWNGYGRCLRRNRKRPDFFCAGDQSEPKDDNDNDEESDEELTISNDDHQIKKRDIHVDPKTSEQMQQISSWNASLRRNRKKTDFFSSPDWTISKKLDSECSNESEINHDSPRSIPLEDNVSQKSPRSNKETILNSDVPKKTAVSISNVKESSTRAECTYEKDPNVGKLVWAKFGSHRLWPAIVVEGPTFNKKPASSGNCWLFWFGDHKVSQICLSKTMPFAEEFAFMYGKVKPGKTFLKGVLEAIMECGKRCGKDLSELDECKILEWAMEGFTPTTGGHQRQDVFQPDKKYPVPSAIMSHLGALGEAFQQEKDECPKPFRSECKKNKGEIFQSVRDGSVKIEEVCIACDDHGSDPVVTQHPFFSGGLCRNCKEDIMETMFAIGEDGTKVYCTVCGNGGELYLCDSPTCGRVYCIGCVEILVGSQRSQMIQTMSPWLCFLCMEYCSDTHGLLHGKHDWQENIIKLFHAGTITQIPSPLKSQNRRPLRVLSLFDGIGTGKYILDQLGLAVEVYYASEIDDDSIGVTKIQHGPAIVQLGDITKLDKDKIGELCPIDLLIGGSPCNDLSLCNPAQKGIYDGTGKLFFHYYRILNKLRELNGDHYLFWLFENVVFMKRESKEAISTFLECEPAMWDAKYFSAQQRARYFWGNIPGMYCPPPMKHPQANFTLDDMLTPNFNRKATVGKIRTVTTRSNSLKQCHDLIFPVTMGGTGDTIWIQELERNPNTIIFEWLESRAERFWTAKLHVEVVVVWSTTAVIEKESLNEGIFGFPQHYTDVCNFTPSKRQILLGRCWSVPVVQYLLSPLQEFFLKTMDRASPDHSENS